MSNVSKPAPAINSPSDLLLNARNKLLEACAIGQVVADELCALPAGMVPESLQALGNVFERLVRESFDTVEELSAMVARPPAPPSPPAPNN